MLALAPRPDQGEPRHPLQRKPRESIEPPTPRHSLASLGVPCWLPCLRIRSGCRLLGSGSPQIEAVRRYLIGQDVVVQPLAKRNHLRRGIVYTRCGASHIQRMACRSDRSRPGVQLPRLRQTRNRSRVAWRVRRITPRRTQWCQCRISRRWTAGIVSGPAADSPDARPASLDLETSLTYIEGKKPPALAGGLLQHKKPGPRPHRSPRQERETYGWAS
jgi:hypothetical protein